MIRGLMCLIERVAVMARLSFSLTVLNRIKQAKNDDEDLDN